MRRLRLIAIVSFALSGCAALKPDWVFDCEWARVRDLQEAYAARSAGMPHYDKFSRIYCDDNPSGIDYWSSGAARVKPTATQPNSKR